MRNEYVYEKSASAGELENAETSESEQKPLHGAVLCWTSIPPEQRDVMCATAQEMGAATKLDLTADVTHMIIGATDTPKYKYVARHRPEVKVLHPSWLDAVRATWVAGGEVDLAQLESQHRLPTLWQLNICVTGFNDLQERNDIAETIGANGATYHGNLTKHVSHLIAATPSGKKYEYAGQWGIKIVAIEWLMQSLERGMMLDEELYSPTMSPETRGLGATSFSKGQANEDSPSRKRKLQQGSKVQMGVEGKRKLRRTASTRLESQNSGIWADLGGGETSQSRTGAEWDEEQSTGSAKESLSVSRKDSYRPDTPQSQPTFTTGGPKVQHDINLIFDSCTFIIHGFDRRKTKILYDHLQSNGGKVTEPDGIEACINAGNTVTGIVPHEKTLQQSTESLHLDKKFLNALNFVTEFWVEKCIFAKEQIDRNATPLCQALDTFCIANLPDSMTLTPTAFSGIELLHLSKIVKLIGISYDETLRSTTSILICGSGSRPTPDKLRFAFDHGVPVVRDTWLWDTLQAGSAQVIEEYLLVGRQKARQTTERQRGSTNLKDTQPQARRPASPQTNRKRSPPPSSRSQPSRKDPRPQLELSKRQATPDHDHSDMRWSQPGSQPLRELSQNEANSRSQPSMNQKDKEASNTISFVTRDISFLTEDDEPFRPSPDNDVIRPPEDSEHLQPPEEGDTDQQQPIESEEPGEPEKPTETQQSRAALSDAIAQLRAHKRTISNSDHSPKNRRHRPLGRATSNPSSIGSRQDSLQQPPDPFEDEGFDDGFDTRRKKEEIPMPSQALGYEHEESKLMRERLLNKDASWDGEEENGLRRVESVGKVKDGTIAGAMKEAMGARKSRVAKPRAFV